VSRLWGLYSVGSDTSSSLKGWRLLQISKWLLQIEQLEWWMASGMMYSHCFLLTGLYGLCLVKWPPLPVPVPGAPICCLGVNMIHCATQLILSDGPHCPKDGNQIVLCLLQQSLYSSEEMGFTLIAFVDWMIEFTHFSLHNKEKKINNIECPHYSSLYFVYVRTYMFLLC